MVLVCLGKDKAKCNPPFFYLFPPLRGLLWVGNGKRPIKHPPQERGRNPKQSVNRRAHTGGWHETLFVCPEERWRIRWKLLPLDSVSRVRAICRDWNEDKECRGPGVGWGSLVVGSSISGHNAPSQAGYTEYCQTFIHLWLTALKAKHMIYRRHGREISAFAIAFSRSWTLLCVFVLPQ